MIQDLFRKKHVIFRKDRINYALFGEALKTDDTNVLRDGQKYHLKKDFGKLIQIKEFPNRYFAKSYFDFVR